ncbi:Pkinase-domain-containing protein [Favolaschia claudopus]|uniref:Pkinase-domain-containing protein n=1 Tax=Favolaschia claudopus TaxID=2862362 RepID=A0AAW0CVN7_9AGAR
MQDHEPRQPVKYETGRFLGHGTYATVKEAIDVETGEVYACKIINKELIKGREYLVVNEIAILNRLSRGHPNIVTLHDYFETQHNLYLCFTLCTGGPLLDRICLREEFNEVDAAGIVRTTFGALKYIHGAGIVHRDLKPENLLFSTDGADAEIMIADFGLSSVLDEKLSLLTGICGTPSYMAPEIFHLEGHGKPVDIWAMGVIAYYMLVGRTPFDRSTSQAERRAIMAGDLEFDPREWACVSVVAQEFVCACLTMDPAGRPTAEVALDHPWLASTTPHFVPDMLFDGRPLNLLPHLKRRFDEKSKMNLDRGQNSEPPTSGSGTRRFFQQWSCPAT